MRVYDLRKMVIMTTRSAKIMFSAGWNVGFLMLTVLYLPFKNVRMEVVVDRMRWC
jgi:hypothetical protein